MPIGRLYNFGSEEALVSVDYRFYDESPLHWWGELVPKEYRRLGDGDGYIIELEDGRRGRCSLRKRVNRAVSSTPPLYYYYFRGMGYFESPGQPEPGGGIIA
ncbi:MAG: hypothetical protein JW790_04020 [Dehalococcoidales bacterium]|nr:hypothetical protein [Dehalococcoidales bacterium]